MISKYINPDFFLGDRYMLSSHNDNTKLSKQLLAPWVRGWEPL